MTPKQRNWPDILLSLLRTALMAGAVGIAVWTQGQIYPPPIRMSLDAMLFRYGVAGVLFVSALLLKRDIEDTGTAIEEGLNTVSLRIFRLRIVDPFLWIGLLTVAYSIWNMMPSRSANAATGREGGDLGLTIRFLPLLAGFAVMGLGRRPRPEAKTPKKKRRFRGNFYDRPSVIVGAVAIVVACGLGIYSFRLFYSGASGNLAILLIFTALGLCIAALKFIDWRRGKEWFGLFNGLDLEEWPVLVLILLIGAFLRIHQLSSIPEGIWCDEAEFGIESRNIVEGMYPYDPTAKLSHNASFSLYWTALFFRILGNNVFSLRFPIVLWGLVTIYYLYRLARLLFGKGAAVGSSLILAVMFWHIVFSRFNMPNLILPGCAVIAFYLFLKGEYTGKLTTTFLSGVFLSLCLHAYKPGIMVLLMFTLFVVHRFAFHRSARTLGYLGRILLVLFSFYLTFIPLDAVRRKDREKFDSRVRQTVIWRDYLIDAGKPENKGSPKVNWIRLWKDAKEPSSKIRIDFKNSLNKHLLMMNYTSDPIHRHGIVGAPRLDRVTGSLFVLGLAVVCFGFLESRYFLVLCWWFVPLLAGILTLPFEAPQSARTILAVPGTALTAGCVLNSAFLILRRSGVGRCVGAFIGGFGKRDPIRCAEKGARFDVAVIISAFALLGAYLTMENHRLYFKDHQVRPEVWGTARGRFGYQGLDTTLARFLKDTPDDYTVYWTGSDGRHIGYFRAKEMDFASRPDLGENGGILARYETMQIGEKPIERIQRSLSLAEFQDNVSGEVRLKFKWTGGIFIPESGEWNLRWDPPLKDAGIWVDGEKIHDMDPELMKGWHPFEAGGNIPAGATSEIQAAAARTRWTVPSEDGKGKAPWFDERDYHKIPLGRLSPDSMYRTIDTIQPWMAIPPSQPAQGGAAYIADWGQVPCPKEFWLDVFGDGDFTIKEFPYPDLPLKPPPRSRPGPLAFRFLVSEETINKNQGLTARYTSTDPDLPAAEFVQSGLSLGEAKGWVGAGKPFRFEWEGTLFVDRNKRCRFEWREERAPDIQIDGRSVGYQPFDLIAGRHDILVRGEAEPLSSGQLLIAFENEPPRPPDKNHLFARKLPEHGLSGTYYIRSDWNGSPSYVEVDPLLDFNWEASPLIEEEFAIRWKGYLVVETPGNYKFELQTGPKGIVRLNEQELIRKPEGQTIVRMVLEAGECPIEVLIHRKRGPGDKIARLFWTKPDGTREIIPYSNLRRYKSDK